MPIFTLESNFSKSIVEARNRKEAFADYFSDLIKKKIPIDKIGQLVMLTDKSGGQYAMRVVPLLYAFYVVGRETAVKNIEATIEITKEEAEELLDQCVERDRETYGKLILDRLNIKN